MSSSSRPDLRRSSTLMWPFVWPGVESSRTEPSSKRSIAWPKEAKESTFAAPKSSARQS